MKSVLVLLLFLPLAIDPQSPDWKNFLALESAWNEAHVSGDAIVLDQLWSEDLEVTVPRMPVMSKTEALGFARSGKMKFQKYQTSDLNVRVYGDAAVVSGRLQRERSLNGKTFEDDWRFTKVYIRRNERWQVVAFHCSDAGQP
ncbi:MAG TPA: nuclear transport factor 2 family protein [Terriglobales bacterium]|nr:nuclear transport factor 2 family protein [Terriglobales bacterium]